MTHGFEITRIDKNLICEGIIGDGCGGGRLFFIQDETLFANDPMTNENILLLENIHMPRCISKRGCVVSIQCESELIEFDLSSMSKTTKNI